MFTLNEFIKEYDSLNDADKLYWACLFDNSERAERDCLKAGYSNRSYFVLHNSTVEEFMKEWED